MGNKAKFSIFGFVCPVRGCDKKNKRRFGPRGITEHLLSKHPGEFEKRLKLKKEYRK